MKNRGTKFGLFREYTKGNTDCIIGFHEQLSSTMQASDLPFSESDVTGGQTDLAVQVNPNWTPANEAIARGDYYLPSLRANFIVTYRRLSNLRMSMLFKRYCTSGSC